MKPKILLSVINQREEDEEETKFSSLPPLY